MTTAALKRPDGELVLQGRSPVAKFILGLAISGILPLLFMIYLGFPSLFPKVVAEAYIGWSRFYFF